MSATYGTVYSFNSLGLSLHYKRIDHTIATQKHGSVNNKELNHIIEMTSMCSDLLSKQLFLAGCFGLPWLWIVHVLYATKGSLENDEGLLNPDDHK